MGIKRKKCPVCNSSRVSSSEKGFQCKKCGYINQEEIVLDENKNGPEGI